ncbi:MAG: protein jag [Clostridia bacterium]|nr:protein jag [Clostridia bacterium]
MRQVEESAKNVDLAIEKALTKLGITQNQAEIEVLSAGGLFKQAKVRITKKQTEGDVAAKFVEEVLEKMGLTFVVELEESETDVKLELTGTETGCVIGYRGEVLDSLQYLASLVANKGKEGYKRIILDTENYREKRVEKLNSLAKNLESKAMRIRKPVKLEPMNSFERRIIHSALQNSENVVTKSEGTSPNRYVVIVPKDYSPSAQKPERKKMHKFVYRSDKKRR